MQEILILTEDYPKMMMGSVMMSLVNRQNEQQAKRLENLKLTEPIRLEKLLDWRTDDPKSNLDLMADPNSIHNPSCHPTYPNHNRRIKIETIIMPSSMTY